MCGAIPETNRYLRTLELDMGDVEASLAAETPAGSRGVRRCAESLAASAELELNTAQRDRQPVDYTMNGQPYQLPDGALNVIAANTSCTNTSNPSCADGGGITGEKAVTLS